MNVFLWTTFSLFLLTGIPYLLYIGLFIVIRPTGSPAVKKPANPSVSIVLPTYNEEAIIEQKLQGLFELDYPMEKVEIVVVDSSDDSTREIIREFFTERDHPSFILLEEDERRGLAPALNDAYDAASNEMVVKTDCDSVVANDALRQAAANLADSDIAAVTGTNAEVLGGSDVESGYRGIQSYIQRL
ncbi:MAG: glycosyltransferase, partial [Halodesulfurarchaeum sp.]